MFWVCPPFFILSVKGKFPLASAPGGLYLVVVGNLRRRLGETRLSVVHMGSYESEDNLHCHITFIDLIFLDS